MRFVYADVPFGHSMFGRAVPCVCQREQITERARRMLEELDGLLPEERTRLFASSELTPDNAEAFAAVTHALEAKRGQVVLWGAPGVGKTHILHCAVNAARNSGLTAVFSTMTALLDYLRRAYDPEARESLDERWNLLLRADLLAIDEVDRFNGTQWAIQKVQELINERWRRMVDKMTFYSTNSAVTDLVPHVASRLSDSRGHVVFVGGTDRRLTKGA